MVTKYELNLFDYWRIIKRRRWIVLFSVITTIFFTWIFTSLQVHIYQSQVVVKFEPTLFVPGIATDTLGWDSYQAINTEVKIINSPVIIERVAKKLNLIDSNTPEKIVHEVIGSLQGKIKAERITDSNLIRITATSSEKQETARLATAVAEVYIQKGIEDRNRRARELREFVEKQLQDAEKNLKYSEDKLREFTEKNKNYWYRWPTCNGVGRFTK